MNFCEAQVERVNLQCVNLNDSKCVSHLGDISCDFHNNIDWRLQKIQKMHLQSSFKNLGIHLEYTKWEILKFSVHWLSTLLLKTCSVYKNQVRKAHEKVNFARLFYLSINNLKNMFIRWPGKAVTKRCSNFSFVYMGALPKQSLYRSSVIRQSKLNTVWHKKTPLEFENHQVMGDSNKKL